MCIRDRPTPGERRIPELTAEGLIIQAEDFTFEGGVDDVEIKGAQEFYVARAEQADGVAWTDLRVIDGGAYILDFRVLPGRTPLYWALGEGTRRPLVTPPEEERGEHGFGWTGPENLLDGGAPLMGAQGGLRLEQGRLHMDGRRTPAAWLSPSEIRNRGCAAHVKMADEEEGGDDALLLFDMDDVDNGKFAGLTDGGRRFVMGVIEAGKTRVIKAVKAPQPKRGRKEEPRTIKVEYFGGVAVGSLDGKPLTFVNLSEILGEGRFGVKTHGITEVQRVAALEEFEVYTVRFRSGPIVDLPAGRVRLYVELPAGGDALDCIRLRPSED